MRSLTRILPSHPSVGRDSSVDMYVSKLDEGGDDRHKDIMQDMEREREKKKERKKRGPRM